MKPQASTTGLSSRVAMVLVLCGWCVGMGVGVPAAFADSMNSNSVVRQYIADLGGGTGAIEFYIETDKAIYHWGETLHATHRLTNVGDMDVELGILNEPGFNLQVARNDGSVWVANWGWLPRVWALGLAPGEYVEHVYDWDLRDQDGALAPPGEYQVIAITYGAHNVGVDVTIVPEPSVLLLLGAAAVSLLSGKTPPR